jgi:hypothetical protein
MRLFCISFYFKGKGENSYHARFHPELMGNFILQQIQRIKIRGVGWCVRVPVGVGVGVVEEEDITAPKLTPTPYPHPHPHTLTLYYKKRFVIYKKS